MHRKKSRNHHASKSNVTPENPQSDDLLSFVATPQVPPKKDDPEHKANDPLADLLGGPIQNTNTKGNVNINTNANANILNNQNNNTMNSMYNNNNNNSNNLQIKQGEASYTPSSSETLNTNVNQTNIQNKTITMSMFHGWWWDAVCMDVGLCVFLCVSVCFFCTKEIKKQNK